ncbi:tyrosine-type recombinase/integrase [Micromonospora sp. NPDC047670]|uniref:tyrosine-type recombinase/integrase n=1 Tax=Micromonospora sp. NPDC047670 TaxID=3364252 RepID=UPI00371228F0
MEPRSLNRRFVRLLDTAGLRRVRFHDLRHSCATMLYERGVPIEKIQDVLGHSSPTITKLICVEVTRRPQRSTTDKLGYLFDAWRRGHQKGHRAGLNDRPCGCYCWCAARDSNPEPAD